MSSLGRIEQLLPNTLLISLKNYQKVYERKRFDGLKKSLEIWDLTI